MGFARADEPVVGKPAPAWQGKTLGGKTLKSVQFKGKVVLVNFFSYY
jgi:peroxiredoxin